MTHRKFNAGEPVAFLLTWTTYGSWLPGDERGWNRKGLSDIQEPNPLREETALSAMKEKPFLLSEADRRIVEATIEQHCQIRTWKLHAVNARSNHIHVVVSARGYQPVTVAAQFKSWCSRKLRADHADRKNFWSEGSSCRWINFDEDLERAIVYVDEAQDRKGIEG